MKLVLIGQIISKNSDTYLHICRYVYCIQNWLLDLMSKIGYFKVLIKTSKLTLFPHLMLSNLDLEREKKQALARESDRNANDDDRRDTRRAPNRKEAMKLRGMIHS